MAGVCVPVAHAKSQNSSIANALTLAVRRARSSRLARRLVMTGGGDLWNDSLGAVGLALSAARISSDDGISSSS